MDMAHGYYGSSRPFGTLPPIVVAYEIATCWVADSSRAAGSMSGVLGKDLSDNVLDRHRGRLRLIDMDARWVFHDHDRNRGPVLLGRSDDDRRSAQSM